MANHVEELGRLLLEQRGTLTSEICRKAVEEAAAKIERDKALRGVEGLIADLRYYLTKHSRDVDACLKEIRRVLLQSTEILRKSGDNAPKNPPPTNGDKAKGAASHPVSGPVPPRESAR